MSNSAPIAAAVEALRGLTARRVRVIFSRDEMTPPGQLPPGHEFLETAPRLWHLEVRGPLGPLLTMLAGLPVADLQVQEARLEEVLLKYYRDGSVAETPQPLHAPTLRPSDATQPPP